MDCPQCGDHCCCSHTTAGEGGAVFASGHPHQSLLPPDYVPRRVAVGQSFPAGSNDDWRSEVANRVNAHRAKRRRRNGEDDTMSLSFDQPASVAVEEDLPLAPEVPIDDLDSWNSGPLPSAVLPAEGEISEEMFEPQPRIVERRLEKAARKLIEFPRQQASESFHFELAEPVIETPRIFEAEPAPVEEAELPRTQPLATVHLDEGVEWAHPAADPYAQQKFDVPLPVAPLVDRLFSALIDVGVAIAASVTFLGVVYLSSKALPQGKLAVACIALVPVALWSLYQYMFLVFSGSTLGMRLAQLELCDFDGMYPVRSARQCRAAALMLSCMSVGMGFAWVMVDEDSLGWHDRMTKTYLRLASL